MNQTGTENTLAQSVQNALPSFGLISVETHMRSRGHLKLAQTCLNLLRF